MQQAFILHFLNSSEKIWKTDTPFLLALIRSAEKSVGDQVESKKEMENALSQLYKIISDFKPVEKKMKQ